MKSLTVVKKYFVNSSIDKNSSTVQKNAKKLPIKANFQIFMNQHHKFSMNKLPRSQTLLNYDLHPKIKKS